MLSISEITININGKEIKLTKHEALELYNELDQFFGGIKREIYPYIPVQPIQPTIPFPSYTTCTSDITQ